MERYTLDDTGTDVIPDDTESNRPAADPTLSNFSIERDKQTLIPFIKAALTINPNIRFGRSLDAARVDEDRCKKATPRADPPQPSYFDGGTMKNDATTLSAYANYLPEFVQSYQAEGITIDAIAPQDEPTFEQNYPSCLWDKTTYANSHRQPLGASPTERGAQHEDHGRHAGQRSQRYRSDDRGHGRSAGQVVRRFHRHRVNVL